MNRLTALAVITLARWSLSGLIVFVAICTSYRPATAQTLNLREGDFLIKNFHFRSGEVLPELRIHWVTIGTPKRDLAGRITNAVLLLHATGTSGGSFLGPNIAGGNIATQLFGEGQPLDAAQYYLIIPDAIGHGRSSKPSNGLRAKFPRYGYDDTVEAEYQLMKEGLGIDHLRLVLGVSMGGMQTWIWGEKYPDLMDALLPVASQPVQISGRNLLFRRLITEAVRNDPDWHGGNYEMEPSHWWSVLPILQIMLSTPARIQATAPTREKTIALFETVVSLGKSLDANDYLYAWDSSWDYDPQPELGKIKARLLAVNFSDDLVNPPEIGVMDSSILKISNARLVMIPASGESFGHMNYFRAEVWRPYLLELLKSLP